MESKLTSHATHVGIVAIVLYAICILWPFLYPYGADVLAHHMLSLKLVFPGFQGYTMYSIIWGGLLSFFYGFIASIIFHGLHRCCDK